VNRPAGRTTAQRSKGPARWGHLVDLDAATKEAINDETYGPVVEAIALMLAAGEADGTIRPGLDPADVLLLMGSLGRTPETAGGQAQIQRLLDIVSRGLRP
jgi:hypothetical protein